MTSPAAAPETPLFSENRRDAERWIAAVTSDGALSGVAAKQIDNIINALETSIASLRQEVASWKAYWKAETEQKDDAYAKLNAAEARVRELEEQHRWNIREDGDALIVCKGLHDKSEACGEVRYVPENQLAAAEADKLDAQRYRYYMGLLFYPKGDWPLEFQDAQSLDELNAAFDTAAAKQGEA